jgi:hypothetical protein
MCPYEMNNFDYFMTLDLSLMLKLVQLYDPDYPMVVDLLYQMDLRRRKLILLACLIFFYLILLQVLRLVLMTIAHEQFLG